MRRLFLLLLPALFLSTPGQAQSSVADSLRQLLSRAQKDTQRVNLLCELAWDINESDTKEASTLYQEAIALAQKSAFPKGEATAWNGLGVVEEVLRYSSLSER